MLTAEKKTLQSNEAINNLTYKKGRGYEQNNLYKFN